MAETSSPALPSKPVVVRVKRKPSQSPLDAFWLEINERPFKRPLLDFGNLSLSDSPQKVEFHNKKVFMQHVETISSSEVTIDLVQSFVDPGSSCASDSKSKTVERKGIKKDNGPQKQDQLLFKAKQDKESLAKDARFKQIWKSRKGNKGTEHEKELQEICNLYDIVRVDNDEKVKEVQQEDISLEDQILLSSYLPMLREVIPNAASEIEADMVAQSKKESYVYDLYTVNDEMDMDVEDSSYSYPLVQVDEEEEYYDELDDPDYESDDSNAENNPVNDYPDEESEEEEDAGSKTSKSESEEGEGDKTSSESSDEELEHVADPLYDEEFDDYGGVSYDFEDEDEDDEDWR